MKRILYGTLSILALAVLWFGYYALSPLLRIVALDEPVPDQAQIATHTETDTAVETEGKREMFAYVVGTAGHSATGTVRVLEAEGKKYVRYEDFKTINGPDLYVYLAKDLEAKEYLDLGVIRATEGNVNYEIPEGIDLTQYQYVLTWCKQFGVLFNYADISEIR
ncbi:hypothetical protein A3C87_01975 [Candidatus Kaiserbacteria bacterium RIFCSPHIGHO2_02_FULL_49_34]|uniref:DM13 domain-containing protein n=1 Tax=Candidatus Kaiserbacteria bacterium RIFCSPHIGHO2_02_FULL_49_34 TaxID=1798491 RepID=A0A1F6DIA0_9BACT|nr:MAG: hypothetical protein A3C87_01975 [Candidatus Kaiserbacteria bacterium RIFCSPHIGHO2_02_FULL_49_34]